jgi:rhodanese-related sulfurtransferase
MQRIDRETLKSWLEENMNFLFINVLPEKYYLKEHIPGSDNIPVSDSNLEVKALEKAGDDKNKAIVVYCADRECQASPKAARRLDKSGFTNIYDYEGGIKDWKEAGYSTRSGTGT